MNLINWGTFSIDSRTYKDIASAIENLPEDFKRNKQLLKQGPASRPYRGRTRVERYWFRVKTGGLKISKNMLSRSGTNLSKNSRTNEFEERIWTADSPSISIKHCIRGIIIPEIEINAFNQETTESFTELKEELENIIGPDYQVITY